MTQWLSVTLGVIRQKSQAALWICCVLLCAYALKRHYALATATELRWILEPTRALVTALSGHSFAFEPDIGFVNTSLAVAIVPSCAGVNFLIIAWCTLAFSGAWHLRGVGQTLGWLVGAALTAFTATLCVNSGRILIAMEVMAEHRTEGVVLYLSTLMLLHLVARSLLMHCRQAHSRAATQHA